MLGVLKKAEIRNLEILGVCAAEGFSYALPNLM